VTKLGDELRTTPKATEHPTTRDLEWAAGFLEGEGCFQLNGMGRYTQRVSAVQVQKQPIEKLQRLFGGTVKEMGARNNAKAHWRWSVYGGRARGVMMTLYTLMSPRRQTQIRAALDGPQCV
jgi:hypothetical protein